MLRIINIDDYVLNEAKKVISYASEHPYDESYRILLKSGDVLPVGDNPDHVVHIHQGYRAVYSITTLDSKRYQHLSISVEEKGKYPGIPESEMILDLFGMGKDIHDLENVWMEEDVQAINFLKEEVV